MRSWGYKTGVHDAFLGVHNAFLGVHDAFMGVLVADHNVIFRTNACTGRSARNAEADRLGFCQILYLEEQLIYLYTKTRRWTDQLTNHNNSNNNKQLTVSTRRYHFVEMLSITNDDENENEQRSNNKDVDNICTFSIVQGYIMADVVITMEILRNY